MPEKFTQEMIDQYLNQKLSGPELEAFESRLNSDADFKKEIELQGLIHRGANKFGEAAMRAKLKKIRAEVLHAEPEQVVQETKAKVVPLVRKKKIRYILRWSAAAAIALVIGAFIYTMATFQNMSTDDLYANYYQPYSEEITVRGTENAPQIRQATELYQDKKYAEALPIFRQLLTAEPANAELQLVLGICELELNNYTNATQTFSSVTNPLYKDQAQWYLAMTFLKQSDLGSARTILESIREGDFNYKEAQAILEQM